MANPALASDYITYVGQPILAVAATSEEIAETALDRIRIDFERRDFVVDPLESLSPNGPDAYPEGNALVRTQEEGPEGLPDLLPAFSPAHCPQDRHPDHWGRDSPEGRRRNPGARNQSECGQVQFRRFLQKLPLLPELVDRHR